MSQLSNRQTYLQHTQPPSSLHAHTTIAKQEKKKYACLKKIRKNPIFILFSRGEGGKRVWVSPVVGLASTSQFELPLLPQHDVAVLNGSPFSSYAFLCVLFVYVLFPYCTSFWVVFFIMPTETKSPCAWPSLLFPPSPDLTPSPTPLTFFYSFAPQQKQAKQELYYSIYMRTRRPSQDAT